MQRQFIHMYYFSLILFVSAVYLQNPEWIVYTSSNTGLPNRIVNALAKDNNEDIWIGTEAGLAKFDGKIWSVYNVFNSGLINIQIRSLAIDDLGNKWIGTAIGLAKFDNTEWDFYDADNSEIPHHSIQSLAIDDNGHTWIGASSESYDRVLKIR